MLDASTARGSHYLCNDLPVRRRKPSGKSVKWGKTTFHPRLGAMPLFADCECLVVHIQYVLVENAI